jgi:hypothetical protein
MIELLQNEAFIFWTSITLICTVPVIMHYWYKIRRAELETALKRDMIEHGMSAEDIQKVLRASSRKYCEEGREVAKNRPLAG